MKASAQSIRGVTLVEMAIVLLILGILTRAAIAPLSAVQSLRLQKQGVTQLESIRNAMWAHVVSFGVLPCPVNVGVPQSDAAALLCDQSQGGVPARSLGLSGPVDESGALLDPWGQPFRLAVSQASHEQLGVRAEPDWTSVGEASRIGIAELKADIVVCKQAETGRCPEAEIRASDLAFVVLTTGSDYSPNGDQLENMDADTVFTMQEHSVNSERPFDDLLLWGTAAETVYWMLRAGWLP